MRPGQAERHTHDYKRHGTTSLFAALDVKAGTVIGKCMRRHRAQEFRKFLDCIERNVPAELDIHIVMDNASSHKTRLIRNWFAKRPRWSIHFTPTSSSWINQVERFFALLSEERINRSQSWRRPSTPSSTLAMRTPLRSNGPNPPTTSWLLSSASAAELSQSTQKLNRNFGIGTLAESAAECFPEAAWQRCVVHWYRNIFSHVPS